VINNQNKTTRTGSAEMEKETDQLDIAIGLMREQRYVEALPLFLRLIDINPDDWSLHYMAGQCFRFTNEFSQSVQFLSKAASLNSKDPQIFLALGIAHQLSDSYELK